MDHDDDDASHASAWRRGGGGRGSSLGHGNRRPSLSVFLSVSRSAAQSQRSAGPRFTGGPGNEEFSTTGIAESQDARAMIGEAAAAAEQGGKALPNEGNAGTGEERGLGWLWSAWIGNRGKTQTVISKPLGPWPGHRRGQVDASGQGGRGRSAGRTLPPAAPRPRRSSRLWPPETLAQKERQLLLPRHWLLLCCGASSDSSSSETPLLWEKREGTVAIFSPCESSRHMKLRRTLSDEG